MKRILGICSLLAAFTLLGALGLYFIEGDYSLLDAAYMSVITLSTVGYREVHTLSPPGKIFIMAFIIVGLGVFLFCIAQLGELIISNQFNVWMKNRKMDTTLKALKNHFLICGFGRIGETVCEKLAQRGHGFIVIDHDEEQLDRCKVEGWPYLLGDATDDSILQLAGIERARGLAAVLASDSDNLFIVFSARLIRGDLQILARASDRKQGAKMEKAGANRIVSPYTAGATKIAQLLASPHVEDFMEIVVGGSEQLDLAEIQIDANSDYAGARLADTDFTNRGIVIVGIRRADGELLLPPPSQAKIQVTDSLIALGNANSIRELCERC